MDAQQKIENIQRAIRTTEAGQITFFNTEDFPWTKDVEALWPGIRAEADRVLAVSGMLPGYEEIQLDQRQLTNDKRWKIFPFFTYGHEAQGCQDYCPITMQALKLIPGVRSAMYSILKAGKVLPAHTGPYNGVLRYHLGITVPEPEKCGLTVGFETRRWYEGKSMIFDDSFMHSASNMSDKDRIVLFADFERCDLSPDLAQANKCVIDEIGRIFFITHAVENWLEWQEKHGAEFRQAMMRLRL